MGGGNAPVEAVVERIRAVYGRWGRDTTVEEMRRDWETFLCSVEPAEPGERVSANGVEAEWIAAPGARADRLYLYFHGGGFQLGSIATHRALMTRLSAASGARALGVGYRRAPEHRFPAPVDDALAAWEWVLAQGFAPEQVALAGDSAGGGLALSMLVALRDRGLPLPACAAVMSPWTDMEATGETYETRAAADPIHQRPMILALARAYLGRDGNPRDPLASPLLADLRGLPPLLVQAGDRETVLDDARAFADKAREADVEVELDVREDMIHVFQLFAAELDEGREAIGRIGAFLDRHLG